MRTTIKIPLKKCKKCKHHLVVSKELLAVIFRCLVTNETYVYMPGQNSGLVICENEDMLND